MTTGVPAATCGAALGRDGAQRLRRDGEDDDGRRRRPRRCRRSRGSAASSAMPGRWRGFSRRGVDRGDGVGVAGPERHVAVRRGRRRAPAPCPMHRRRGCRSRVIMPSLPWRRCRASARPSDRAASAGAPATSRVSARPSARRSAPAHAIITALSVQRRDGRRDQAEAVARRPLRGARRGSPRWRRRRRRRPVRRAADVRWRKRAWRGAARLATTSVTAAWNDAQRSATSWSDSGAAASAARRTAVFRPEKEKSAPGRSISGRGRSKRARVAARRRGLDRGAAGIGEAEELRDLVEGLAQRVVDGGADAAVARRRPRRRRTACGRRRRAGADRETAMPSVRRAVSAWPSRWLMATSGFLAASAIALAVVRPTSTPPIRPGPGGRGDGVDVGEGDAGLASSPRCTTPSSASTWARAAISGTTPPKIGVGVGLAEDDVGENFAAAVGVARDDGGGGFVAARFDAEDKHGARSPALLPAKPQLACVHVRRYSIQRGQSRPNTRNKAFAIGRDTARHAAAARWRWCRRKRRARRWPPHSR